MMAGMEAGEAEGVDVFYSADDCMMSALREGFDVFASVGLDGEATTLEEYAALVEQAGGLTTSFETDGNGNPFMTYTSVVDGNDIFYYATLRKGTDAFWVVNFACMDAQQAEYLPQFEQWSNSIVVE